MGDRIGKLAKKSKNIRPKKIAKRLKTEKTVKELTVKLKKDRDSTGKFVKK